MASIEKDASIERSKRALGVLGFSAGVVWSRNLHMQRLWTRERFDRLCSMFQTNIKTLGICVGVSEAQICKYLKENKFPIPVCLLLENMEQTVFSSLLGERWRNPTVDPSVSVAVMVQAMRVISRGDSNDPAALARLTLEKMGVDKDVDSEEKK